MKAAILLLSSLTTVLSQETTTPNNGPSNDGTLAERTALCTSSSQALVNAYKNCFVLFPTASESFEEADKKAVEFVQCVCGSEWKAGSLAQLSSSTPLCPPIPNVSKGEQAAVAADCVLKDSPGRQSRIIQSFHLITIVNKQKYVPLSGLPPGVTSGSSRSIQELWLVLALMYISI